MKKNDFNRKLENFQKSLSALEASCLAPVKEDRDLSGIIKDFELCYELAWKTLKQFLEQNGHEVRSARETFAKAYQLKYLSNEETWLEMIEDRNLSVHTYDHALAVAMVERIQKKYLAALLALPALF